MKKLIVMVLVVMTALVLCACGEGASSETDKEDANPKPETEKKEETEPEHSDDEFTIESITYELVDESDPSIGTNFYLKVRNNTDETVDMLEIVIRALDENGDVIETPYNATVFNLASGQAGETDLAQFHPSSGQTIKSIEALTCNVYKKNEEDVYEELYTHDYEKPIVFNMTDMQKR